MGWVEGFEPSATGTTIRRSTKLSYTHREADSMVSTAEEAIKWQNARFGMKPKRAVVSSAEWTGHQRSGCRGGMTPPRVRRAGQRAKRGLRRQGGLSARFRSRYTAANIAPTRAGRYLGREVRAAGDAHAVAHPQFPAVGGALQASPNKGARSAHANAPGTDWGASAGMGYTTSTRIRSGN